MHVRKDFHQLVQGRITPELCNQRPIFLEW